MTVENTENQNTTEEGTAGESSGTGTSWEESEKQETTTEPEGEKTQAEKEAKEAADENHPTKLGRKVKEQGEQIATLLNTVRELTEVIKSSQTNNNATQRGEVSDRYDGGQYEQMVKIAGPPPVETIVTPKDQYLVKQWEDRATSVLRDRYQENYTKGYFGKLNDDELKEIGGDYHQRIVALVTNPKDKGQKYNKKQTGNPMVDAKLNYLEALKDIVSGKTVEDDTSTFNKGNASGSGVTKPTGEIKKSVTAPKLSDAAKEYADYFNMTPEARADAMSRKGGVVGRL